MMTIISATLVKCWDSLNSNYEKFLLIGDFNTVDHETEISNFLNNHEGKNIVKKHVSKVFWILCVNLFITNNAKSFQHIHTFSCGISGYRNLVVTVLKNIFEKQNLM